MDIIYLFFSSPCLNLHIPQVPSSAEAESKIDDVISNVDFFSIYDQIEKELLLQVIFGHSLEDRINTYCNMTTLDHKTPSPMEIDHQALQPGDTLDKANIDAYMEDKLNLPCLISKDQFFMMMPMSLLPKKRK